MLHSLRPICFSKKLISNLKFIFVFLIAVIINFGCAVGPLTVHETARTQKAHHGEISGAYGNSGYTLKWSHGLTDNFDIGVQYESLSLGVRAKYAFMNNQEEGFSLAAAVGTGVSFGGSHYYGDLMASYLHKSFEPYSNLRFVQVHAEPLTFNNDLGKEIFKTSAYDCYGEYTLGSRFWFRPDFCLSLEAAGLFSTSSSVNLGTPFLFSAGLVLNY